MKTHRNRFKINLGKKIAELRKVKGFKQKDLALVLGCSLGNIGSIESGWANPPLDKLYKICALFDCDIFDIIPSVKDVKQSDFNRV